MAKTRYRMLTKGELDRLSPGDFRNFGTMTRHEGVSTLWMIEAEEGYSAEDLKPIRRNADGHWTTPTPGLVWKPYAEAARSGAAQGGAAQGGADDES